MKKIIFILAVLFSLNAKAQTGLDTIQVRTLTLQAQDWAWLVGGVSDNDSATITAVRAIRTKVQATANPTWTTNITLDALPAIIVIRFYANTVSASAAEISARYTAIKSAISAKTNISYWIGLIDGQTSSDFDRKRNLGKNKILD